jgi:micrococcal nuclease
MDSPELHHPQKPKQCFGEEALRSLQTKVEGKVVQLEKDVSETDKYHRLLRYVWIDNELVNETQVRTGVAFARSFPPDIARQATLLNAERLARSEQVGLWSGCQVDIKKKSTQPVKVQ